MDEVDAVTLKLDSDSSHILCGACLLYATDEPEEQGGVPFDGPASGGAAAAAAAAADTDGADGAAAAAAAAGVRGTCEAVVHYCQRASAEGAVRHSGDTQVDGKSVHTISVVLSKVPAEVSQLYFTLCSCGPSDLSGFRNPSIMLYENAQPDANLLEYSIGQAAQSPSCVMARMIRGPARTSGEQALVAALLRKKLRLPLLCIDLVLAMSAESSWAIQALGTEEWNLAAKICCHYEPAQELIEERLRTNTSADAKTVGATSGARRNSQVGGGVPGGGGA